ncbi:Lactonase, 7-bladed beta-propeller-domain-containing protein [Podospora fimiseda]|uniref:Lactonase, 7-bladed beta-propeller-domain-containing protein n=1 Tax=Podospora fimiseda TaxID=252190 RepID=A0AAN7GZS8_9PEZI|nr:Lactonase, 7-bladed beta-propeller-domain-containing protein [Podospora fimiseda]
MRSTTRAAAAILSAGLSLTNAAPCAQPSQLLVATYPAVEGTVGGITTFTLGTNTLTKGAKSDSCGAYPSWITFGTKDQLYCVNEAWPSPNGDFYSIKANEDGTLTRLSGVSTQGGPVSIVIFGPGNAGAAVAAYAGGGIDTFAIENPSEVSALEDKKFPVPTGDGATEAQKQSRPHQAVLDPTGEFLVFPDLGSDLVRVFQVDSTTLKLAEKESLQLARGTGPRHATFFKGADKTYLYLLNEIANTLKVFTVTYSGESLSFQEIYSESSHGPGKSTPAGTAAAEITISPDNKFVTLSSRLENSQEYTLLNGTTIKSDPLITYSLDAATGLPTHVQTIAAGGYNPRHFSFNKAGTLVASALQAEGRIVVFERDVASGKIGKAIAEADIEGLPNFVTFRE